MLALPLGERSASILIFDVGECVAPPCLLLLDGKAHSLDSKKVRTWTADQKELPWEVCCSNASAAVSNLDSKDGD